MAKIKDIASDLFNLAKGIGLSKEATGAQQEFSLDKFTGKIQERNSLARANRFVVKIAPPAWAAGQADTVNDLMFFCDAVNLPGASIVPVDIKKQGYGTFDRRASNIIPEEVTCSIMLDSAGRNLSFFHQWLANIVNMNARYGEDGAVNGATTGEVYYRDHYLSPKIEIEVYDTAARLTNRVTCYDIWPSQVSPVSLGWTQNDEFARVQVNFQLRYFTENNAEVAIGSDPRELSAFEQILRIGQSAKALKSSLKTPNNVGDVINVVSNGQTFLKALGGKI